MFTCMMEFQNVSIRAEDMKWWRVRTDLSSNTPLLIKENVRFNINSTIKGGVLTSVLMINGLRSAFIGPYWFGMTDSKQHIPLSDIAFLSIIPSSKCTCCM